MKKINCISPLIIIFIIFIINLSLIECLGLETAAGLETQAIILIRESANAYNKGDVITAIDKSGIAYILSSTNNNKKILKNLLTKYFLNNSVKSTDKITSLRFERLKTLICNNDSIIETDTAVLPNKHNRFSLELFGMPLDSFLVPGLGQIKKGGIFNIIRGSIYLAGVSATAFLTYNKHRAADKKYNQYLSTADEM